jgi:4-carboxymuconolactone decarboxylase
MTGMSADERFIAGLEIRREVLGVEHVERALAGSDFSRVMQDFVTEYCWGGVWTRPGLDLRTRSLINVAMLAALGWGHELEAHVRGALTNGATEEEIRETLLQAAVYAGMPAGLEAFRRADSVLAVVKERLNDGHPNNRRSRSDADEQEPERSA